MWQGLRAAYGRCPVALLNEGTKAVFGRILNKCQKANELRKKYGLLAPVQDAATLLGEKLCDFEATTIVWLEPESLSIDLDLPGDTEMRFLTASEVELSRNFRSNPRWSRELTRPAIFAMPVLLMASWLRTAGTRSPRKFPLTISGW